MEKESIIESAANSATSTGNYLHIICVIIIISILVITAVCLLINSSKKAYSNYKLATTPGQKAIHCNWMRYVKWPVSYSEKDIEKSWKKEKRKIILEQFEIDLLGSIVLAIILFVIALLFFI